MMSPGHKPVAWSLARALILAGDSEKSEKILRKAVALDPEYDAASLNISDANALILLGHEAFQRKQLKKSEILFQKAVENQPESEEANFEYGMALWRNNKHSAAESAFQKVLSINSENHQAYEYLGKIYAVRNDLTRAITSVEKALELKPSWPELEKIYHLLKERLARKNEAKEDFQFFFATGNQKARQGDLEAAFDMFLKAAEIKKTASLMYNLGLVSHRMEKEEEALAYLKESLDLDPTDRNAKSLYRYILHHQTDAVRVGAESKTQ
jgi:tetratricopeptide (TPR) repeat protein